MLTHMAMALWEFFSQDAVLYSIAGFALGTILVLLKDRFS